MVGEAVYQCNFPGKEFGKHIKKLKVAFLANVSWSVCIWPPCPAGFHYITNNMLEIVKCMDYVTAITTAIPTTTTI